MRLKTDDTGPQGQLILFVDCVWKMQADWGKHCFKSVFALIWLFLFFHNQELSWRPTMWATAARKCPSGARVTAVGTSGRAASASCICSATIFVCVSKVSRAQDNSTNQIQTRMSDVSFLIDNLMTEEMEPFSCYFFKYNLNWYWALALTEHFIMH